MASRKQTTGTSSTLQEEVQEQFEGAMEEYREADEGVAMEARHYVGAPDEFASLEAETEDEDAHEGVSSAESQEIQELGDVEAPNVGENGSLADVRAEELFAETRAVSPLEAGLEMPGEFDLRMLEMTESSLLDEIGEDRLLDAYMLEFGDPAVNALLQQHPELVKSTAEVIIGKDDRIRVANTTVYPWRCICQLTIELKTGQTAVGTGWLVGPRTVITAGHCVYMHNYGGWAKRITVRPGRNGSSFPFGEAVSSQFHSVKGWTEKKNRSNDYGAIILPPSQPFGTRLGYFGYANHNLLSLLGKVVNLSGYPAGSNNPENKPYGHQWWHARSITFVAPRYFVYNIDTQGGQSGSPVWRLIDGKRYVVGIHTNGSSLGNSATRITKPVFDNIKNWKNMYA